jgi:hypothetical protein
MERFRTPGERVERGAGVSGRDALQRHILQDPLAIGPDVLVPKVAPMMTPTACANVTSPALTKPMTVNVVAVEDWIATVKSAPETIALSLPATSACKMRRSESPARPFNPSVR